MRDLSATKLEATQKKSMIDALWKIVLTSGVTTLTYDKTRVLDIKHTEEAFSHKATVLLDNSDGTLTDLALEGYQGVISYGMITKAGEEYSATAPLTVIAQELDSSPGQLTCTLELIGIPNMLAEDRASVSYVPASDDTKTVKDIINDMFDDTMTAYSHCETYTVDWDDEDDLIDVYTPKDGFRIYKGGTRLAALRRLIDYTKCVAIFDADGHITIKEPTTTGSTYDYEYSLANTYHTFFAKAYRKRLVIPNKIQVDTDPDADTPYTGSAVDAVSYAALGHYITQFETAHLDDDDQGDDIAEAMMLKYQLNAEAGAGSVPMNVGAEVYDYVKITDAREDDYREGNIGNLVRHVNAKKGTWEMRFSFGGWLSVRQRINELETYPSGIGSAGQYFSRLSAKDVYIENLQADNILLYTMDDISDGDTYSRVLATHITAGQIVIDEHISYTSGYDPTDKLDKTDDSLDDVPDGTTYTRLLSTQISAGKISLTDTAVFQSGYDPTDKLDKDDDSLDDVPEGTTYQRVLATQISAGKISLTSTGFLIDEDHITAYAGGVEIDGANGIVISSSEEADACFEMQYDDDPVLLLYYNYVQGEVTIQSYSGSSLRIKAADDLILEAAGDDVSIRSNDIIKLEDVAVAGEDIESGDTTQDIGDTSQFDNIFCQDIDVDNPPWDEFDDLALLRNMRAKDDDPKHFDMSTVPDALRTTKEQFMAKAEMKAEKTKQKHLGRFQQRDKELNRVIEVIGKNIDKPFKPKAKAQLRAKLNGAKEEKIKVARRINEVDTVKQEYLAKADKHYDDYISKTIKVNRLAFLSAGALKQVSFKLDSIETRLQALEAK